MERWEDKFNKKFNRRDLEMKTFIQECIDQYKVENIKLEHSKFMYQFYLVFSFFLIGALILVKF